MNIKPLLLAAAIVIASPAVLAQSGHDGHQMSAAAESTKAASPSEGTVRKIDKAASKITIAHGPLENLGMPAMTMAFRVSDAAMLDRVKVGDKIRFVAERADGAFGVKSMEVVK